MPSCWCVNMCLRQCSNAFTTCANCVSSIGNSVVMLLRDWCLRSSCHGWIILQCHPRRSPSLNTCAIAEGASRRRLSGYRPAATWPRITGPPGIALVTDRLRTIPSVLPIPDTMLLKAGNADTRYSTWCRCRYWQWSDSGDRQLTTAQLVGVCDISPPGPFPPVTTI